MRTCPRNTILVGDAAEQLQQLPVSCVDTVVTSPPYYQLRDNGHDGQIGLEDNMDEWVTKVTAVGDQLARVLKPQGSWWLNVNDSWSRATRYGAPPKGLLLGPERLLLALMERGWRVRNKIVWAKPNHMPDPVRDRLTNAWEPLYLLVRSQNYYFDIDAIRVPHRSRRQYRNSRPPGRPRRPDWAGPLLGNQSGLAKIKAEGRVGHRLGKNPGDVWVVTKSNHSHGHHAVFPEALIERPILATCPQHVCAACGSPWQRPPQASNSCAHAEPNPPQPACSCNAASTPGLVLDPFMGAGTTGVVAQQLRREWLGIELNPSFAASALTRIASHDRQKDTFGKGPS